MHSALTADASKSVLLVVDYQEPVLAGVEGAERLVENSLLLFEIARILDVPFVVAEQNPAKLGATVEPIREGLGAAYRPVAKMSFSAFDESVEGHLGGYFNHAPQHVRGHAVLKCLTGIE